METSKLRQKSLWLAGTLLVGALGSGLWEAALKPSLFWVGSLVLDVATLGMTSLRDSLYVDVARGSYERASVMNMAVLLGALSGAMIGLVIIQIMVKHLDKAGRARTNVMRWLFQAITISYAMILMIQCFRITYIVRATNHISQMERIVSPYVSKQDILLIDSRVARMKTREEYIAITNELNTIVERNDLNPPTFNIY